MDKTTGEGVELCAQHTKLPDANHKTVTATKNDRAKILTFLYLVCLIEGLDISLLPASLKALETEAGLTPSKLGLLGMSQGVFQSVSGLVWGSMADRGYSRKALIGAGTLGWASLTILLGVSTSFEALFILRCLNGFALASLSPIAQSVLSDVADPEQRGVAFGMTQFSWNLGMGVSSLCVTAVSQMTVDVLGVPVSGWRVAFILVGVLSLLLFIGVIFLMPEVHRTSGAHRTYGTETCGLNLADELRLLRSYFTIPSFVVILVQAVFGLVPWAALSFLIVWLQYLGLSDLASGAVAMCLNFSCAVGGPIGGWVGDRLSTWSRFHGRPLTAQLSVTAGIVLFIVILLALPREWQTLPVMATLITMFGLTASWAGVGCNSPLLLELVDERSTARVIALLNAISGAASAMFGGPVVGLLAEVMGYVVPADNATVELMPQEDRERNSAALTKALVAGTIPPWGLCLIAFTLLHFTYKRDVQRAVPARSAGAGGKSDGDSMVTDALIAQKFEPPPPPPVALAEAQTDCEPTEQTACMTAQN